QLLRDAVAKQVAAYGHEYYVAKARADQRATELWDDLGRNGYLGVNVAETYGGGGMGISELAIVAEELTAQGCPLLLIVVSPATRPPARPACRCSSCPATHRGCNGRSSRSRSWPPRSSTPCSSTT